MTFCIDCGCPLTQPINGQLPVCAGCQDKREEKRFSRLTKILWDGDTPFAIFESDIWFSDATEFLVYCEENEIDPLTVRLVLGVPSKLQTVSDDYFDLVEGCDLPDEVSQRLDSLNEAIMQYNQNPERVCQWEPSEEYSIDPFSVIDE